MQFEILTELYNSPRLNEIVYCLNANSNNPLISTINIFAADNPDLKGKKSNLVKINGRLTYKTAIDWLKDQSKKDIIYIVANSDIIFDNTLSRLDYNDLKTRVAVLTRHEMRAINMFQGTIVAKPNSQDAWFFTKENITRIDTDWLDFPLGTWGCDSNVNSYLVKQGLQPFNPCLDVNAWHFHINQFRTYWNLRFNKDVNAGVYMGVGFTTSKNPNSEYTVDVDNFDHFKHLTKTNHAI